MNFFWSSSWQIKKQYWLGIYRANERQRGSRGSIPNPSHSLSRLLREKTTEFACGIGALQTRAATVILCIPRAEETHTIVA